MSNPFLQMPKFDKWTTYINLDNVCWITYTDDGTGRLEIQFVGGSSVWVRKEDEADFIRTFNAKQKND